jgi:hypothetical protein
MSLTEDFGRAVGALSSPLIRAGSALRHARVFHPDGLTCRAEVTPLAVPRELAPVVSRLTGSALVRLSSAFWRRRREWPDLLGLSVRLHAGGDVTGEPSADDQDLLFATIRRPWTLGFALLTTNTHDFLRNDYYAVAPFEVEGLGRAQLRVMSLRSEDSGDGAQDFSDNSRDERLKAALHADRARFRFEVLADEGESAGRWTPLAELRLVEEVTVDPATLRFQPFRTGRGFKPVGFIHALRLPTYRHSQEARARH